MILKRSTSRHAVKANVISNRLLSGQFDLVDCLHDYRHAITIHGDDVLSHQNWEIAESWLKRYKYVHSPSATGSILLIYYTM